MCSVVVIVIAVIVRSHKIVCVEEDDPTTNQPHRII